MHFASDLSATKVREAYFSTGEIVCVPEAICKFLEDFVGTETYAMLKRLYKKYQDEKDIWRKSPYPVQVLCADAVVECNSKILLIQRKENDYWALPGGHVEPTETFLQCSLRELEEEASLKIEVKNGRNRILTVKSKVFDKPGRSPNRAVRVATTAFYFDISGDYRTGAKRPEVQAGDDAKDAEWFTREQIRAMILHDDHKQIIEEFVQLNPSGWDDLSFN